MRDLVEHMEQWRSDNPSEWIMDELIREAESLTKQRDSLIAAIKEHKELMRSWNQGMGVSHVNNKLWSHIESLEGGE